MITVSAYTWVPPFAQGYVRDLRVRWALGEAGMAYEERLIDLADRKSDFNRRWQPFGQVPSAEIDGVPLFESGAIVLSIAETSSALMPDSAEQRLQVLTWTICALNTMEPPIASLAGLSFFKEEAWVEGARPQYAGLVAQRLDDLARWLDGRDYLVDRFTAADILMADVLRLLDDTTLVSDRPALAAYKARCLDRPAFRTALADQLRVFEKAPESGAG